MTAQLLTVIKSNYQEAIAALLTEELDTDMRSYYEGRRDVLGELLITMNLMEQK